MKLSELSTDRAADVLCELTPYVHNIVTDKDIGENIGKAADTNGLTKYGVVMLFMDRLCASVPALLKNRRPDVYGILSVLGERTVEEIAAQPLLDTLAQIHDALYDEAMVSFFKSFARRDASAPSAPSSAVPG